MKNNLTALNDKTVYLVVCEETEKIIYGPTDNKFEAYKKANVKDSYFVSEYPPFTYAPNKDDSFIHWPF